MLIYRPDFVKCLKVTVGTNWSHPLLSFCGWCEIITQKTAMPCSYLKEDRSSKSPSIISKSVISKRELGFISLCQPTC